MPAHFDEPAPFTRVDPLCFFVRGWVRLEGPPERIASIEAWCGEQLLGSTSVLYSRPDVSAALSLEADARTGFELFCHHAGATPTRPFELELRARRPDGTRTDPLVRREVIAIERDYRTNHFGILLDRTTTAVQGRANVFAEGPSQAEGSADVARLLRRHLGPPPKRVVDVGCGLGSYGRGLLAAGYDWLGVEVDPHDCAELARMGLPHRQVDGRSLPYPDGHFEAALCLEVLEHLPDPRSFLAEVQRVAPRQLLVSVPNCELLGYLWDHRAAPWHMLEADHRNYFTRWSLAALLREFYPEVEVGFHTPYPLRTVEGTPLYYHLFAAARGSA